MSPFYSCPLHPDPFSTGGKKLFFFCVFTVLYTSLLLCRNHTLFFFLFAGRILLFASCIFLVRFSVGVIYLTHYAHVQGLKPGLTATPVFCFCSLLACARLGPTGS